MSQPLVIELFCGTFGWSHGWLARGGTAVGFDLEHEAWHGPVPENAHLVLQDVRTLHGSQFRHASLILASPPCPEFSYMAMPWKRAKQIARALRGQDVFPDGYTGSRSVEELTALFDACFRLQREACEAAGRHIPMVVENVRGAVPWVGPAAWSFGSYYLWGDVPALMPQTHRAQKLAERSTKNSGGGSWFNVAHGKPHVADNPSHGGESTRRKLDSFGWRQDTPLRNNSSKSHARRAASALIARIPERLSEWIADVYYPSEYRGVA